MGGWGVVDVDVCQAALESNINININRVAWYPKSLLFAIARGHFVVIFHQLSKRLTVFYRLDPCVTT